MKQTNFLKHSRVQITNIDVKSLLQLIARKYSMSAKDVSEVELGFFKRGDG